MGNPVLVELTRGLWRESVHAGAVAVARANGELVAAVGDVARPIFPRSAIKPLQALPLIETGAADRYALGARELAIACASHSGTREHAATVAKVMLMAGLDVSALSCGTQEPLDSRRPGACQRRPSASALNHNCSGKHAGMLATAVHKAEASEGTGCLITPSEPHSQGLGRRRGSASRRDLRGIDGCSAPNWALPLVSLAAAFARS